MEENLYTSEKIIILPTYDKYDTVLEISITQNDVLTNLEKNSLSKRVT